MKGIILAGGKGSRLYPLTTAVSKHILPVYNKPMIYYPLSVLMLAKIKDILIISTEHDINLYKRILGDGGFLGLNICYAVQTAPNGIAEAFIIGEKFIGNDNVSLILGDNIFYGHNFINLLDDCYNFTNGATIFGYNVSDPENYGIINFDEHGNIINITEKPERLKKAERPERYKRHEMPAVTGLYFYDNKVIEYAKNLKASDRGELEITDINNIYLKEKKLKVIFFGRGMTWLDAGTHEGLLEASNFVRTVEARQGLKIACVEEIAYKNKFINKEQFMKIITKFNNNEYGEYLKTII